MDAAVLQRYWESFGRLKRNSAQGHGAAPHKPILLLAILDEIEGGRAVDNLITLTPELILVFEQYWKTLVQDPYWQRKIEYPFRHLYQEGFWHFVVYDQEVTPEPRSYSLKQLKEDFDGARLSPDLWTLLQDVAAREALRNQLLGTYFQLSIASQPDVVALIHHEAEKLKEQAQSVFRVRKVRESDEAGYFVRHALFPGVIKDLYLRRCAVCELAARAPESGVVDAAHILPFAKFHNDDPRNGIAFCRNHHWGFDTGMFALTDRYTITVSPRLQDGKDFLVAGKPILLPDNPRYAPDPAALKWHRDNVFQQ